MAVLKAVIASTDFPNVQEYRRSQSCSGGYRKRQSKHGFLGDDNGDGDGKVTLSNPPNGRIDI
jgi:hypothetical protein